MNTNTILNICGIILGIAAAACLVVSIFRSRQRESAGLHPLSFAGFGLILAAKLCDLLRFQPSDRLLLDGFVCFALLFGMVGSYVRTYSGTWKQPGT